jgi:hypothetical protein
LLHEYFLLRGRERERETMMYILINGFRLIYLLISTLNSSALLFVSFCPSSTIQQSLEHSGLGRYGDALNPWGDLLALARAWCVTKPGGWLYLGLPSCGDGYLSNLHRMYGKIRWPLITTNWIPIYADQTNYSNDYGQPFSGECLYGGKNGGIGYLFHKDE